MENVFLCFIMVYKLVLLSIVVLTEIVT